MRPLLISTQQEEALEVFVQGRIHLQTLHPCQEVTSHKPKTEFFALHLGLLINVPHHRTLCFCLSWGDSLILRGIAI